MKRLILLSLSLVISSVAFGWGQKGHDVTAAIAEQHLTRKAAKAVHRILEGQSPVYWSNWLDNASHTPEYASTKTWHYLNVEEGQTLDEARRIPEGDVLKAVTEIADRLRAGELTPEEEAVNLRMLIHLVGDMHCPMHLGRLSDLGGNRREVRFFGRRTNLHSVWDTDLPEAGHRWSYTEWQQQIDRASKAEQQAITAGAPEEWARETHAVCTEIYDATPEGTEISYDYVARFTPVVERQLLRGGLRLAHLLNEIYR